MSSKWTRFEDGLPEDYALIAFISCDNDCRAIKGGVFIEDYGLFEYVSPNRWEQRHATHWCYLPKLPDAEREDK